MENGTAGGGAGGEVGQQGKGAALNVASAVKSQSIKQMKKMKAVGDSSLQLGRTMLSNIGLGKDTR